MELDGKTFTGERLLGHELAPGVKINLRFVDGRICGYTGCNRFSAPYAAVDGLLEVGPFACTMMACVDGTMEAETWLMTFLSGKPNIALDDALTLVGDGVELVLSETA